MRYLRYLLLLALALASACQAESTVSPPTYTVPAPMPSATTLSPTLLPATSTYTVAPTSIATITPLPPTASPTASVAPVTTLLFTGVIVPARCVQAALDELGDPDYPYEEVRDLITGADLAVGVFNATMSHQVEHTGCVWTYQLVGSPDNADALERAGFDVMSVATNHIKDCGLMKSWCDYTFFDTLENLRRVGILAVGAGADLEQALQPVVVTVNGVRFGFVSLGDSKMTETVFAAPDYPGIAHLDEENAQVSLEAARKVADVVIALPHWGSEDIVVPNWLQQEQARYLVAAGADLVVGNHTHVVQAITEIDGVQVFYGLGNFVFDQGLRDHRQGAILLVKFEGSRYLGYELIPTHVDPDGRVHIADAEEAADVFERIEQASQMVR